MKTIIIDDEQDSRDTLGNYLSKYCPDIEIVAYGEGIKSGLEAIKTHQPQLVFLDVEMPFGNGFDLLEQVDDINFQIIFVTAYSQYAIPALNLSASYYILKPVDIDELIIAVNKVKEELSADKATVTELLMTNIGELNKQKKRIMLPLLDGFEIASLQDILYLKADDNFTLFYFTDGSSKLICRTLKYYENILSSLDFTRIHRSHLVNLHHIIKYNKGKGGYVTLSEHTELEVSTSRKKDFLAKLGLL